MLSQGEFDPSLKETVQSEKERQWAQQDEWKVCFMNFSNFKKNQHYEAFWGDKKDFVETT